VKVLAIFILCVAASLLGILWLGYSTCNEPPIPKPETQQSESNKNYECSSPEIAFKLGVVQTWRLAKEAHQEIITIATVIIAFFTIILGTYTVVLAASTKQLVFEARRASVHQLRAYVFVKEVKFLSHLDLETRKIFWSLKPVWENSGSTFTKDLFLNVNWYIETGPLPEDFKFPPGGTNYDIRSLMGPRSTVGGAEIHVTGAVLAEVQQGKKHFYMWGWAKYNDLFEGTPDRVTKFCYHVQFRGDPARAFDSKMNPAEFIFNHYRKHNCADDECAREERELGLAP